MGFVSAAPATERKELEVTCRAPVESEREVKNSGGDVELRPFIRTRIRLGNIEWTMDLNLTNRENMKYRMLIGREALDRFLVEPTRNCVIGSSLKNAYEN